MKQSAQRERAAKITEVLSSSGKDKKEPSIGKKNIMLKKNTKQGHISSSVSQRPLPTVGAHYYLHPTHHHVRLEAADPFTLESREHRGPRALPTSSDTFMCQWLTPGGHHHLGSTYEAG